jgi:hypothetical protein
MSMSVRTESEEIFERYLDGQDIAWTRVADSGQKHPDYKVERSGVTCFFEIKEFADPAVKPSGGFSPCPAIQEKILQAKKQFKAYRQHCCALVLWAKSRRRNRIEEDTSIDAFAQPMSQALARHRFIVDHFAGRSRTEDYARNLYVPILRTARTESVSKYDDQRDCYRGPIPTQSPVAKANYESSRILQYLLHCSMLLQPRFVGFSDSFVVSVPLAPVNGDMEPLVRIFSALSAASTIMMAALASKHAVRGGIEVGLGVEIGPEEIYGTALGEAYELESKFAQYPRVLIGKTFPDYLSAAGKEFSARKADALCAMVQKIMDLTAVENGERYLDYLGGVMSQLAKPGEGKIMVQPGYDFIVGEHERFIAAKDAKLAERYGKVRGYYESRLPLWGLDKK